MVVVFLVVIFERRGELDLGRGGSDSSVNCAGGPPRHTLKGHPELYQRHQGAKETCRAVYGRPTIVYGGWR